MQREYPRYPIPAVGAVAISNGKILLVKRGVPPGRGFWSIPGGAIEVGERIEDAVKREFKEETGLECEVLDLCHIAQVIIKDKDGRVKYHYIILDYLVKTEDSKEPSPGGDVLDAEWFELKEVLKLELTKPTRELIKKLLGIKNKDSQTL
ncbi:MAG: NUDIX hydrolase [Candidatus Njordarchaeales archaeon]